MPVSCVCLVCQRIFPAYPSEIRLGGGKYCSVPCYRQRKLPHLGERFWYFVRKTDGCWLWQGKHNNKGYGLIALKQTDHILAHRLAYELTYGMILPGIVCCHHCDTPLCVRPDHLFLGTQGDNLRDMFKKQRHGAHTHPERLARGKKSGRRLHPESYPHGEQAPHAKLTENQVRTIRHLRATQQISYARLASLFRVSPTLIRHIIARKRWSHVL